MPKEISLPIGLKLSPFHAIYCRDGDALAIADLHLGYEASLQAEHVAMPRFQMKQIFERIDWLLKRFDPATVIINGDLKHEFSRNKGQEWDEVEELLDRLEGRDVIVVRGNHDNYLRNILAGRGLEMAESHTIPEGRITFRHGHLTGETWNGFMIFGHEHPVIRFRDEVGAKVQLPCFLYDETNGLMVMPAFSPLASGTDVISPESEFMNPSLRKLDLSGARVYGIHSELLDFGTVGELRKMRQEISDSEMKDRYTGKRLE